MKEGLSWDEIVSLQRLIKGIALKYAGDMDLASDVMQEVSLMLHTDRSLNPANFEPRNKAAALRNIIRNKVLTVLSSKTKGRSQFLSLDMLTDGGSQVNTNREFLNNTHPTLSEVFEYEGEPRDDSY